MATGSTFLSCKTTLPKKQEIKRKWHWIDAKGLVLGRLSTKIASLLVGKHKTCYTPTVDCGDFVIVTRVEAVKLTGTKLNDKHYFYHTSHPGGAKVLPWKKLMQDRPEKLLFVSVKRMLPKTRLASRQILRLKIYRGVTHPHGVQNPEEFKL